MDKETKEILSKNKHIEEMIMSEGWKIAKELLLNKMLDLQNAFQIEDKDPQSMLTDLRARRLAQTLLLEWLQELTGASAVMEDNKPVMPSYIVKLD